MQDTNLSASQGNSQASPAWALQPGVHGYETENPDFWPTFPKSTRFIQEQLKQMLEEKLKADPEHTPDQVPLVLEGAVANVQAVAAHEFPDIQQTRTVNLVPGMAAIVKTKYPEALEYLHRFVIMKRELSDEQILGRLQGAEAELLDAVV